MALIEGVSQHYLAQFDIKWNRHIRLDGCVAVWLENGEISYYSCKLPIAKNGDRIEIGCSYELDFDDEPFVVTSMSFFNLRWFIAGVCGEHEENVEPFNLLKKI
jgi:hypothetical protein